MNKSLGEKDYFLSPDRGDINGKEARLFKAEEKT